MTTIFKAVENAKSHLENILGGRIVESTIDQDGDTYTIWCKFADGISHKVYVSVESGKVLDDIQF
jgi:hypothetical protein